MKKKTFKLQIEDHVLEEAAKELAKRIDFSVMAGLLAESGWIHVKARGEVDVEELYNWVEQNAKDDYHYYLEEYVFKSGSDANWFKLRWDSLPGDPILRH